MKKSIIIKWIQEMLQQDLGTKIFIPVESRGEGLTLKASFDKEITTLSNIDPEGASSLLTGVIYKEKAFWLVIERVKGNTLVGFIKRPGERLQRVKVIVDSERERRIELMLQEGKGLEEIEAMEGPLEQEEIDRINRKGGML